MRTKFNWRILLTLLLVVFACAATWSLITRSKPNVAIAAGGSEPDYVLHNFELIALNANGVEAFSVRAPLLKRNETDQHLDLVSPNFSIPRSTQAGVDSQSTRSRHRSQGGRAADAVLPRSAVLARDAGDHGGIQV